MAEKDSPKSEGTNEATVAEAEKQGENLVKEAGSNPLKKLAANKAAEELVRQANKQAENILNEAQFKLLNNNYTYDPRNGILNSIISSGQVNIISNKELKYLMASLKEWTVDAFENTMKIENQRDNLLYSTLHNNDIFKDDKIVGWNWKASYDHSPFRTFTNILFFYTRRDGLIEEYELKKALKHIIELLENDIEK